jgi:adenylylsulfate kinase
MSEATIKNLVGHKGFVSTTDREVLLHQKGQVILLTGLSGSGKSTIAAEVERKLHQLNKLSYILDGDTVRLGLNKDLGFSKEDRVENMRRMKELALILSDIGIIVLLSFIAPIEKERQVFATTFGGRYKEIYVTCPIEVCKSRDPKGLYIKVAHRDIKEFTGVSSIYEPPTAPDLVLNTHELSLEASVELVLEQIDLS